MNSKLTFLLNTIFLKCAYHSLPNIQIRKDGISKLQSSNFVEVQPG